LIFDMDVCFSAQVFAAGRVLRLPNLLLLA